MSTQQDDSHDDITLRDVVNHMTQGFQRLEGMIKGNSKRIDRNEKIMIEGFQNVQQHFDDAKRHREILQEDLEATMLGQYRIKRHLGMVREE